MHEALESKPCVICQATDHQLVYQFEADLYDRDIYETASWDGRLSIGGRIVQCNNCALVYANPSFKEAYLHLVYPSDIVPSQMNKEAELVAGKKKYQQIVRAIKRIAHPKDVICDIGTRYGVLPSLIESDTGLEACGIEYNAASVAVGQSWGNKIVQGTIADLGGALESFGYNERRVMVVMDDVLEHLVDPNRDIGLISEAQKPGDYLCLRQMDMDSLGHRLYRKDWYYLAPAGHMFYFDEHSIRQLLDNNGYDIEKIIRFPDWKNYLKMSVKALRDKIRSLRRKPKKNCYVNGKIIFLDNRKKSHDDMFLVIAKKR